VFPDKPGVRVSRLLLLRGCGLLHLGERAEQEDSNRIPARQLQAGLFLLEQSAEGLGVGVFLGGSTVPQLPRARSQKNAAKRAQLFSAHGRNLNASSGKGKGKS